MAKVRVAVFCGGRSPEHDVSIVTGIQVLRAIDRERYEPFLVYVSISGEWFVGDKLTEHGTYLPNAQIREQLTAVDLQAGGVLQPRGGGGGLFGKKKAGIGFDVAMQAFHGLIGEDGGFQGTMEMAGIPYTGMRLLGSAVAMDKAVTKRLLADTGVPMLPFFEIKRRQVPDALPAGFSFPVIVKPARLGSSIGVAKATNMDELRAAAQLIFLYDQKAIVEPFVANLVEYNVAVRRDGEGLATSAIEQPRTSAELLDFREKYSRGGSGKGGTKEIGTVSEGMLAMTRIINPELPADVSGKIREWAKAVYWRLEGSGAPRLDFVSNKATGEIWFNEINPCPGSFGFFLWQAAEKPLLFTELTTHLLEEAVQLHREGQLPADPVPSEARLFKRST
jgi:D-alanine-D-alanine ligase